MERYLTKLKYTALFFSSFVIEPISNHQAYLEIARLLAAKQEYAQAVNAFQATPLEDLAEYLHVLIKAGQTEQAIALLEAKPTLSRDEFWQYITLLTPHSLSKAQTALIERAQTDPSLDWYYALSNTPSPLVTNFFIEKGKSPPSPAISIVIYDYLYRLQPELSSQYLSHFKEKYPYNPQIQQRVAANFIQTGEYHQAIVTYEKFQTQIPQATEELFKLYLWTNRQEKALSTLPKAIQINPKFAQEAQAHLSLSNGQPRAALQLLEASQLQPSALYSLAGLYTQFGETTTALNIYQSLDDPNAAGFIREIQDREGLAITSRMLFRNEDSPGRLANISTLEERAGVTYQKGKWTWEAGVSLWQGLPKGSEWVSAQGVYARTAYQGKNFFGTANFQWLEFNQELPTQWLGGAVLGWREDLWNVSLAYSREALRPNQFAIDQNIQSDNILFSAAITAHPKLNLSVTGRYSFFSDNNTQGELSGQALYTLLRSAGDLTIGANVTYIDTQNITQEQMFSDEVVYPYWTPENYLRGGIVLKWAHTVQKQETQGKNSLRYNLQVFSNYDTTENLLFGGGAGLLWEPVRNLILEANGSLERSPAWNGAALDLKCTILF